MAQIRVRARAVDMLGRQQIAGIPTAIHELFKNAHDAFARRVEVDYYRKDHLLVLRDDGFGMTQGDFESRWLTLGTESKLESRQVTAPWLGAHGRRTREILGEKGIGRLAIAAIGRLVLVQSRAHKEDGLHDLVAALVHWGLFELPGIDLDRIQIPVVSVRDGKLPNAAVVQTLAKRMLATIDMLAPDVPEKELAALRADLANPTHDPEKIEEFMQGDLSLRGSGHGTHFHVFHVDPILNSDIDPGDDDIATPLLRNLLGFSNTMHEGAATIQACFRDHHADGVVDELIADGSFFTPDEFAAADHHFEGTFDEFGQFAGTVTVFGTKERHEVRWAGAQGLKTDCGPFRIRVAYLQGRPHESRLPLEQYQALSFKLDKIGGLYIYRDGIRILPYGNSDFDFLDIERRRTKSAQDWFFSYRRMFGAVSLAQEHNMSLQEKAGREGFRANRAFRQLKEILTSFFQTVAKDFFRPDGPHGDVFWAIKDEAKRKKAVLAKQERRAKERKKNFARQLDEFFKSVEEGRPSVEATAIEQWLRDGLFRVAALGDPLETGNALIRLERELRAKQAGLRQQFKLSRPSGVSLSRALKDDWQGHQKRFQELEERVFLPLDEQVEMHLRAFTKKHLGSIDNRLRVLRSVEDLGSLKKREGRTLRSEAVESVSLVQQSAAESIRHSLKKLDRGIEEILIEFERTATDGLRDRELETLRRNLQQAVTTVAEEESSFLQRLRDQMNNLAEALREGDTLDEYTTAIQDKATDLEAELDKYMEWAQTGMAIGIIQHEFANTVKEMRHSIRQLKPWADGTPDMAVIHTRLKRSFEHLDGYLKVFTPLSRRLTRARVRLTGEEIRRYLVAVLGARLDRHEIRIDASTGFDRKTITVFPSTFLPVFINLLDNAIYWISHHDGAEHWIRLDADGEAFLVSNGGPGVEQRYADRIFDFGESFKSEHGRGMGLYISRQTLKREGWNVTLDEAGLKIPPCFRIAPLKEVVEV